MPPSKDTVKEFDFNAKDFERVRGLIYKRAGISLADSKQEMVYSRLARRLRATGIDSSPNTSTTSKQAAWATSGSRSPTR
jgi:chemotaxis protein methyltransferase CheR